MEKIGFNELALESIGNSHEIVGVVYGNGHDKMIIMIPDYNFVEDGDDSTTWVLEPTLEEWQMIIRQSDLKEVEVIGEDKAKKIILRKSTRQIETSVMWEVFRRDKYTCRYCGNDKVPMTVDHVVLWEEGGPSIVKNLICSCKKCNNTRGNMQYEEWLESDKYKARSHKLSGYDHLRNVIPLDVIPEIREKHMRVHKRKR